jgi:hypothetical protein
LRVLRRPPGYVVRWWIFTAVATCGVAVGDGHEPPGQAGQLPVQAGLVALDGEDPVRAALGKVDDVVALAVQCVSGHHDVA